MSALLDSHYRAYENTCKLPQLTGFSQAMKLAFPQLKP
jgi:hypothetical protein